jgi:hypothetical protein
MAQAVSSMMSFFIIFMYLVLNECPLYNWGRFEV